MRKFLIPLVLALALSACTNPNVDPKTRWITDLATACTTYASALHVLAQRRGLGKLKASTIRTVDAVIKVVHPVCGEGAMVTDARVALGVVAGEINKLVLLKGQ